VYAFNGGYLNQLRNVHHIAQRSLFRSYLKSDIMMEGIVDDNVILVLIHAGALVVMGGGGRNNPKK
jgi:hypothetical protein